MEKSKALVAPQLSKNQFEILNRKTPDKAVLTKPGRGNTQVKYVKVGYVIQTLNDAFGPAWDWEILEQQVGSEQVWVKGKLTVWFSPDFKFTRTAFGGKDISVFSKGHVREGKSVDIADDLKAASADALKKAASTLGVAGDLYMPQLDTTEQTYP